MFAKKEQMKPTKKQLLHLAKITAILIVPGALLAVLAYQAVKKMRGK